MIQETMTKFLTNVINSVLDEYPVMDSTQNNDDNVKDDKVMLKGKASLWKDKIRIYEVKQIALVIEES